MKKSLNEILKVVNTENKCKEAIEVYYWWDSKYWNDPLKRDRIFSISNIVPICPFHKKNEKHKYKLINNRNENNYKFQRFRCKGDRKRRSFSVTDNTIFFDSGVMLSVWFKAYWYYKHREKIEDLRDLAKKLNIDNRTLKSIYSKFDSLQGKEKSLIEDIINKYKVYLKVLDQKKYERGEEIESDVKQKHLQKKKSKNKVLSDKEIIDEFKDDFNPGLIKGLLRLRKDKEEIKKKGTLKD